MARKSCAKANNKLYTFNYKLKPMPKPMPKPMLMPTPINAKGMYINTQAVLILEIYLSDG